MSKKLAFSLTLFVLFLSQLGFAQSSASSHAAASSTAKFNRERGLSMLSQIKELIKERYYDKDFRGINLDERFKTAAEKIKKFDTNYQIFRVIAQVTIDFNDSHTKFIPPSRDTRVEYGFTVQMIGGNCLVTSLKKGSDAEAKGLKVGDILTGIAQYTPARENLWKINYLLYDLDPQESIKLYILNPDKTEREIEVKAAFKPSAEKLLELGKLRQEKRENPYKCQEISPEAIACRLETFRVERKYIDKMMKEVGAHQKLILDLRGNGGGYLDTEEYLTGFFFDRDVKIGDMVMRDKTKERVAKTQKDRVYKGDLVVLIDSESASASEVFARVIQLEKRGKIVGDVSRGAVMTSNYLQLNDIHGPPNYQLIFPYALNLTIGDLIMSDGKRLENVGVIPDYPVGPSGKSLSEKTDPVLAYSARLLGAKLTAEDAGKFYFVAKKIEENDDENSNEKDN